MGVSHRGSIAGFRSLHVDASAEAHATAAEAAETDEIEKFHEQRIKFTRFPFDGYAVLSCALGALSVSCAVVSVVDITGAGVVVVNCWIGGAALSWNLVSLAVFGGVYLPVGVIVEVLCRVVRSTLSWCPDKGGTVVSRVGLKKAVSASLCISLKSELARATLIRAQHDSDRNQKGDCGKF